MIEILDFFMANTSLKSFHFEPVFECGRCRKSDLKSPEPHLFLEKLIEVREEAAKHFIDIYYSGGRMGAINDVFCGAAGGNFFVTPEGNVSSCLEVTHKDDPRSKIFLYGSYENNHFNFNNDKLNLLKSRKVCNLDNCSDCFAKYNCAGDCLAKVASFGDMFDTSLDYRCDINRGALLYEINKKLSKNGKK